jgi:DNA-binding NarL/FixJ family response regulator
VPFAACVRSGDVTVSVLVVDDHSLVREGVRAELDRDRRLDVVGEAATGAEALALTEQLQPDLVILDLRLGDMDGLAVMQKIKAIAPETVVVVLTASCPPPLIEACIRAGARGVLLKDAENLRLCEQLLDAAAGHSALDPRAADVLADLVRASGPPADTLSPRDVEILRLCAQGLSSREIGLSLGLSEHTIAGYLKEILHKLHVHSRVEAVVVAMKGGLL